MKLGMSRALLLCGAALLVSACGGGPADGSSESSTATPVRCYELVEGDSRAVIKVEPAPNAVDAQGGQVTIYSFLGDTEEFPPETTAGRLESDAFVYGDGTRLALSGDSLTWPEGSRLATVPARGGRPSCARSRNSPSVASAYTSGIAMPVLLPK